jgi:transposase-like protein
MKETKAGQTETEGKTARQRKRAERERWVEAYRTSAQTQAAFAKAHGINLATLQGWIYKRRVVDNGEPGRIEPVRIVGGGLAGATRARGAAITVRWPQGIELAVELDAAGVERLVRELLAPCLR